VTKKVIITKKKKGYPYFKLTNGKEIVVKLSVYMLDQGMQGVRDEKEINLTKINTSGLDGVTFLPTQVEFRVPDTWSNYPISVEFYIRNNNIQEFSVTNKATGKEYANIGVISLEECSEPVIHTIPAEPA
jgi:hypothetical protein